MPSPVGHSMAALVLALLLSPLPVAADWLRRSFRFLLAAVLLASAPDLDYLPGLFMGDWNHFHHELSHTIGWCLLFSTGISLAAWGTRPGLGFHWYILFFAAPLSHLLLDPMTGDHTVPQGIMALWPLSSERFIMDQPLFLNLEKATYAEIFQRHNVEAVLREFLLMLPLVLGALVLRRGSVPQREPGFEPASDG